MDELLDSYQNPVNPAVKGSVETIGTVSHVNGYMEAAEIYAAAGSPWSSDEDAERIARDLSSDRAEGDRRRRAPSGHGSGDRNHADSTDPSRQEDAAERGRASSGEPFEDEADNALFRGGPTDKR